MTAFERFPLSLAYKRFVEHSRSVCWGAQGRTRMFGCHRSATESAHRQDHARGLAIKASAKIFSQTEPKNGYLSINGLASIFKP
jgi:hypothetical protein